MTARVRPATAADLPAIWAIRHANDVAGEADPPPLGEVPPYLAHVLATGCLFVAESGGDVAAYAGVVERGGVTYLTDLFVDPGRQSLGLGRALLEAAFAGVPEGRRCTLASIDPRAIALYARFGMTPRWPNLLLEASTAELTIPPAWAAACAPAHADDPELVALDARCSGRSRPVDLAYWRDEEAGHLLWVHAGEGGERIGYVVVRTGAGRLWHPEAVTIGPSGADSTVRARVALLAAAAWAAGRGGYLELAVPGPHPALPALLAAGFRIVYVETACLGDPALVDPARYAGSGGDLF